MMGPLIKKKVRKPTPKKKTTRKKRTGGKRLTLDSFPEKIRKKAMRYAKNVYATKGTYGLRVEANWEMPRLRTKKDQIVVKTQQIRPVGHTYYGGGNPGTFDTLVKHLTKFNEEAQKKGATMFGSSHHGVHLTAYRIETDEEFLKSREQIELRRAQIMAVRQMSKQHEKKEEEQEKHQKAIRARMDIDNAVATLGVKGAIKYLESKNSEKGE